MGTRNHNDDYDDRRRDESIGDKFQDLALTIKERAKETVDDLSDRFERAKQDHRDPNRGRRDWDDDDDGPVFRGNRNYEGPGVGVGEALVRKPRGPPQSRRAVV